MTDHTQTVLRLLLGRQAEGPPNLTVLADGLYGLEIVRLTGLPNGTLFPLLQRLKKAGWVETYWESDELAEADGRPRRRYYKLTSAGAELAPIALAEATAASAGRISALRPRPEGGGA